MPQITRLFPTRTQLIARKFLPSIGLGALLLSFAPVASAHPGHALHEAGALHLATSPYHLAVIAASGAGLWLAARFVQRTSSRRVLQAVGTIALVTAAVLTQWR